MAKNTKKWVKGAVALAFFAKGADVAVYVSQGCNVDGRDCSIPEVVNMAEDRALYPLLNEDGQLWSFESD